MVLHTCECQLGDPFLQVRLTEASEGGGGQYKGCTSNKGLQGH